MIQWPTNDNAPCWCLTQRWSKHLNWQSSRCRYVGYVCYIYIYNFIAKCLKTVHIVVVMNCVTHFSKIQLQGRSDGFYDFTSTSHLVPMNPFLFEDTCSIIFFWISLNLKRNSIQKSSKLYVPLIMIVIDRSKCLEQEIV